MTYEDELMLSPREFVFLAAGMGAEIMLGVDDPFRGFLVEEIEAEIDSSIIPKLCEKEVLEGEAREKFSLSEQAEALLAAVVFPFTSIVVVKAQRETDEASLEVFHLSSLGAVRQAEHDDQIVLERVEWDPDDILERFGMNESGSAAQKHRVRLPMRILDKLTGQDRRPDRERIREDLLQAGVGEELTNLLSGALGNSLRSGSMVAVERGLGTWEVHGIALLETADGYWLVRPDGANGDEWAVAELMSGNQVKDELRRWLDTKFQSAAFMA